MQVHLPGGKKDNGQITGEEIEVEGPHHAPRVPAVAKWQPEARYATWFYIAPDGKPHGPYDSVTMRKWFDEGYIVFFVLQLPKFAENNLTNNVNIQISKYKK